MQEVAPKRRGRSAEPKSPTDGFFPTEPIPADEALAAGVSGAVRGVPAAPSLNVALAPTLASLGAVTLLPPCLRASSTAPRRRCTDCVWLRALLISVTGYLTETDLDVGQLMLKHDLSPDAVTDVLEVIQHAVERGRADDEPFALSHKALKPRIGSVRELVSDVGSKYKPTAASVSLRTLTGVALLARTLVCAPAGVSV